MSLLSSCSCTAATAAAAAAAEESLDWMTDEGGGGHGMMLHGMAKATLTHCKIADTYGAGLLVAEFLLPTM